eukprot:360597-Alexandrium_andersonii.AAC.1
MSASLVGSEMCIRDSVWGRRRCCRVLGRGGSLVSRGLPPRGVRRWPVRALVPAVSGAFAGRLRGCRVRL